ncbi:MAG TPA: oligosaccharide flippase family protein [Gaiellaceae bacterium]|nr:oligosaccharide flippase family protein [Gaiellaceae bacterium]
MSATEAGGTRIDADASIPGGSSPILTLAKHTIVYGLSGVLLQAVGALTLPIFARAFSQAQYGMLELGLVLASVVQTLVDLGFASAAQRSYYDYPETEPESRRRVLFTAIASTTTIAVVLAAVLAAAHAAISNWLFDGKAADALIVAIAASVPLVNGATMLRETMRLRFRRWSYVISSVLAAIVSAGVAIVLVVAFDVGVEAIFYGAIFGNLLAVVYGAVVCRHDIGLRFSVPDLKVMLAYGLPLVPAALALWALALIDRLLLNRLTDLAEVGQYAVANRLASLLMLGVSAFALAFGPYIFSLYAEDPEAEKLIRAKSLTYFVVVLLTGTVVLTLYSRGAIDLLAPGYDRAYKAVGPLSFGVAFFGISLVVTSGISFARRTRLLPAIAGAAAAVNIALNLVLIPQYGMVGAALATAAGYAVLAVLQHAVAQRVYPTPYETGKVLRALVLAAVFGAVGLVKLEPVAVDLLVKTVALAAFVVSLRVARVVDEEDVAHARRLLQGRLRPAEIAP